MFAIWLFFNFPANMELPEGIVASIKKLIPVFGKYTGLSKPYQFKNELEYRELRL